MLLASTSCVVDDHFICRGRVERRCQDAWVQRCDRYGCMPQYYVDCYDVCIDVPSTPARPVEAGTGARTEAGTVSCTEDAQCPGGTRCSLGRCVDICFADRDCPAGWSCERGLCTDRPSSPPAPGDASAPTSDAAVVDAGSDVAADAPVDASAD